MEQRKKTDRERFIERETEAWYSIFVDGYIGDGVYIEDMDFGEVFDAMSPEERRAALGKGGKQSDGTIQAGGGPDPR